MIFLCGALWLGGKESSAKPLVFSLSFFMFWIPM